MRVKNQKVIVTILRNLSLIFPKNTFGLAFFRMLAPYELDLYGIFVAYVYVYNKGLPQNFCPRSVNNYSFLLKSTASCAPSVRLVRNIFLGPGSVYGGFLKTVTMHV